MTVPMFRKAKRRSSSVNEHLLYYRLRVQGNKSNTYNQSRSYLGEKHKEKNLK